MKIVFVYRGYGENNTNSVIDFQRLSLTAAGAIVLTFPIKGGGIKNYITAIFELRKFVKKERIDIIHAHYSFSGFMAALSGKRPVICSLMGSDILKKGKLSKYTTRFFYKFLWDVTIVKSKEMQQLFPASLIIPNGVDFKNFRPFSKEDGLKKTGFNASDINIIFVAESPTATVKNLTLAKEGIALLKNEKIKLHLISGKPFEELPYYYNAADLLIMTSLSEGSPNVIKEAMACNCPVVATDVGDIKQVTANTEGCFIVNFDPEDVAAKLKLALAFGKRTNGRQVIQHLDSRVIAEKIIGVYKDALTEKSRHSPSPVSMNP